MSGGSHNYIYRDIEFFASKMSDSKIPERKAFAKLLKKVAKAAHDIEWVDSDDCSEGFEIKAIKNALKGVKP